MYLFETGEHEVRLYGCLGEGWLEEELWGNLSDYTSNIDETNSRATRSPRSNFRSEEAR